MDRRKELGIEGRRCGRERRKNVKKMRIIFFYSFICEFIFLLV